MPGATRVEVRIGTKRFAGQDRPVLRDTAFTAAAGECLALLAPSGTGKTTVLRILLGLDTAFDGCIRNDAERIAAVFPEPRLAPWLSVIDNIRLVTPGTKPMPNIQALLLELGIAEAAKQRPAEISLGMARRVALARALAISPDLLVLDEPFASLDPRMARTMAAVLARHARRIGSTVLLATHDLAQALELADRVLVLAGSPATLAADLAVPDRANTALMQRFRRMLRERFPFLATSTAQETALMAAQ
jgi:ABC-type nitrate/sulfonate/bicarbonate transport system ATPase subunit